MLPSHGYQGFRNAPVPSGWVQIGERWALLYNGRETASVTMDGHPGVRLWMEGRKMWQIKDVRAASVQQAKRYAERWCAARLYPELPLRDAVARLTARVSITSPPPAHGLPGTREQKQQARRLTDAAAAAAVSIRAALDPPRPPTTTKPRAKDRTKLWIREGLSNSRSRRANL